MSGWRHDVPLAPLTTYKVGGRARLFASAADGAQVADLVRDAPRPLIVLGRGSNVVVSDRGLPGAVLRLTGGSLEVGEHRVRADAGVALPRLARAAARRGRRGLEFMVGIPGTVGGAVVMNAGCHGTETAQRLEMASVLDAATGSVREMTSRDLDMQYRSTNLGADDVVIGAVFGVEPGSAADAGRVLREITAWRRRTQPGGTLNAGSVFKNPPGDAAGRLIDAAGLKGLRVGDVEVSAKHANFFVAGPQARADDIWRLMWTVRRRVADACGVVLEPELRFLGEFDPPGGDL